MRCPPSLSLVACLFLWLAPASGNEVDPALPDFKPGTVGDAPRLVSVGSDTLNNLITLWAEEFIRHHPKVRVEIEGKGGNTAVGGLLAGMSDIGPMSRPLRDVEITQLTQRFGHPPTQVAVAIDSVAVFVHKDNPIESLTIDQVGRLYAADQPGLKWGDLGLKGEWADTPVTLYGRNSASGTYGFFKDRALSRKDFRETVKELPGSSAVVAAVSKDRFGVGYSGSGYATADVRMVPLRALADGVAYAPVGDDAEPGKYPLSRELWLTFNVPPGGRPKPAVAEFLRLVFSRQGQAIVVKDGYKPISARHARGELFRCGIARAAGDLYRVFDQVAPNADVARRLRELLPQLDSADPEQREAASAAMIELGDAGVLAALRLEHDDLSPEQSARVRRFVADFSRLSEKQIAAACDNPGYAWEALQDQDVQVRQAAKQRLKQLLGRPIAFDPEAAEAEREERRKALRPTMPKAE